MHFYARQRNICANVNFGQIWDFLKNTLFSQRPLKIEKMPKLSDFLKNTLFSLENQLKRLRENSIFGILKFFQCLKFLKMFGPFKSGFSKYKFLWFCQNSVKTQKFLVLLNRVTHIFWKFTKFIFVISHLKGLLMKIS